jgi:LPS sulfotransferase NodH
MTRAIILTTQRTGSTFLEDCLTTHPEIFCEGEILMAGMTIRVPHLIHDSRQLAKLYRFIVGGAWNPTHLMTRFFSSGDKPVRIFKAMYNHLAVPCTLRYLQRDEAIRVLHLRRHNVLKQYVSKLLLSKPRVKAWQPHATKPVPVVRTHVDPEKALENMRKTRAQYEHFERIFASHPRLALVYESMIADGALSTDVQQRICAFLGVSYHAMHSPLIKINPDRLQEMVINYEELARAVKHSEFADLLD